MYVLTSAITVFSDGTIQLLYINLEKHLACLDRSAYSLEVMRSACIPIQIFVYVAETQLCRIFR